MKSDCLYRTKIRKFAGKSSGSKRNLKMVVPSGIEPESTV